MDKRAPPIEQRDETDAALETGSPYYVGNFPLTMRQFDAKKDPITWLMVYLAIAGHVNKRTGKAYPGRERIADLVGISPRQVSRITHLLEERGLVKITRMPAKGGKGYQNVYRIIHDPSLSEADIRSIRGAEPTVKDMQGVTTNQPSYATSSMSPHQHIGTSNPKLANTVSDIQGVSLPSATSSVSHELLEHKNIRDKLENAEQVIKLWITHAWTHGKHQPIADETDLATAHALVAKGVTLEQLERAVIADPEADQLAPLVRSLLP